jgi:hypothetical protein
MSNANTVNSFEHSNNSCDSLKSANVLASEQQSAILMAACISVGTIAGGTIGFASLENAVGPFMSETVLWCTLTSAIVGAAVGQIVAGLTHVIAYGSLDE